MAKRAARGAGQFFVRQVRGLGYTVGMSYTTVEVEIDHGKVTPKEPEKLPESGHGLLTILAPAPGSAARQLEAFNVLARHLNLDEAKAKAWMDTIRDARR